APTLPGNLNRNYQSILTVASATSGDGGSAPSVAGGKGAIFGFGTAAYATNSATNLLAICGGEFDFGLDTGCSAAILCGISTAPYTNSKVHGSVVDTHWMMTANAGVGLVAPRFGIYLSNSGGNAPLDTGAAIFGTDANGGGNYTLAKGLDLTGINFS